MPHQREAKRPHQLRRAIPSQAGRAHAPSGSVLPTESYWFDVASALSRITGKRERLAKSLLILFGVGPEGIEPPTHWASTRRSTN